MFALDRLSLGVDNPSMRSSLGVKSTSAVSPLSDDQISSSLLIKMQNVVWLRVENMEIIYDGGVMILHMEPIEFN